MIALQSSGLTQSSSLPSLHEIGRAVDLPLLVGLIPTVGNRPKGVVQEKLGVPGPLEVSSMRTSAELCCKTSTESTDGFLICWAQNGWFVLEKPSDNNNIITINHNNR